MSETARRSSLGADVARLAGQSAVYTAAMVFTRGIGFLLLPLYTRYIGAEGYGILAVAGIVTSVLGVLLPLGMHAALARAYYDAADEHGRSEAIGTIWLAVAILSFTVVLLLDRLGTPLFHALLPSVSFHPYLRLALWTAAFNAAGVVPLRALQTARRVRAYAVTSAIGVLLGSGAIVVNVVVLEQGVIGFLRGTLIGAAATTLLAALVVRRMSRITLRWPILRATLVFSLPLVPHLISGWILELSDRAILERFVSLEALGVYSVGYQIGMLMSILASSVNSAFAPYLYATEASGSADEFAARTGRLATYYCLGLSVVAVGIIVLTPDLVRAFTAPQFGTATSVVRPVVVGQLAGGLYYLPANMLFIRARTKVIPLLTGVAAVLNIGLNLLLVPRYGIVAAAWTTCISLVVLLISTIWAAARVQRIDYEWRRLGLVTVALVVTVVAGLASASLGGIAGVAARGAALGAFPLTLLLLRFPTPREIAATRQGWQRVLTWRSLREARATPRPRP